MKEWEVLESKYLFQRKWMDVREDRVRLPTGVLIEEFHVIEYPDWVCVLPVSEEGELVLVEQYRHGIARATLEFPAGVIEPGEGVLEAARRELREETGFAAPDFDYLGHCAPEPSRHSNQAHIVAALGARQASAPDPDDNEVISLRTWPVGDWKALALSDEFIHGIHRVALLLASLRGHLG